MIIHAPRTVGVGVCRVCGSSASLLQSHICPSCRENEVKEKPAMRSDTPKVTSVQQASIESTGVLCLAELRALIERTKDWPDASVVYPERTVSGQRDEYVKSKVTINHAENVY